jgi:hypothetical protein
MRTRLVFRHLHLARKSEVLIGKVGESRGQGRKGGDRRISMVLDVALASRTSQLWQDENAAATRKPPDSSDRRSSCW